MADQPDVSCDPREWLDRRAYHREQEQEYRERWGRAENPAKARLAERLETLSDRMWTQCVRNACPSVECSLLTAEYWSTLTHLFGPRN